MTPRSQAKILLVASSYLPNVGGLQSVTSHLAEGLAARGYQAAVIAQRYPRSLPSTEAIDGINVRRMLFLTPRLRYIQNGRLDLFLASLICFPVNLVRLVVMLAREKPDVVNLQFLGAPAFFLLIAQALLRFRYMVSLHGDDVEGLSRGGWFDRWVFRATLREADAVTACSQYLLEEASAIEPKIARKARVIHNGVEFETTLPGALNCSPILAVGRLMPSKGFDVLLRALAAAPLHSRMPNATLIGDGPERRRLEILAHESGLAGRVEFHGVEDHSTVMRRMQASRIVVVPSRRDTFGLVALEAMVAGKPVVATCVGGLAEVLEGADALLVPPDNPSALAQAITGILSRLDSEPEFGYRNRDLAKRFSVGRMVDQYAALYAGE